MSNHSDFILHKNIITYTLKLELFLKSHNFLTVVCPICYDDTLIFTIPWINIEHYRYRGRMPIHV